MTRTGSHGSRVQGIIGHRTLVNREVADAVALNCARSLAAEAGMGAPFPPVVVGARAGVLFFTDYEEIDADESSAVFLDISLRPIADVVGQCISGSHEFSQVRGYLSSGSVSPRARLERRPSYQRCPKLGLLTQVVAST